jgi:hypothetical protein
MIRHIDRAACLLALSGLAACGQSQAPVDDQATVRLASKVAELEQRIATLSARLDELTPETAVLMDQVQIQHAKLYYAGRSGNWELADYTLHEMNEALQAVQTFNDQFEDFSTPLSELVPTLVGPSLGALNEAIRARSKAGFEQAFTSLTAACNACHATLKHGFIRVQPPAAPGFPNQKFAP